MMAKKSSNRGPNRSVVDFATQENLRAALALVADEEQGSCDKPGLTPNNVNDWILPSFDFETTEAQSMKQELRRLQVLKSYLILDSDREESFDRITRVAAASFDVPISLITLIDLGRSWFMSNYGLPTDAREAPRRLAFCAHTIQQKPLYIATDDMSDKSDVYPVLIVPDATKDFRFCGNPSVTGEPFIRFYAGAPLVSPEGYRLGTLCIVSEKARPSGLDASEQRVLKDLAAMTVQLMVDRRNMIDHQGRHAAQMIASTAHELMTPLTGIQLSLSMLKDDDELRNFLGSKRLELLNTGIACADLIQRICQSSVDDLRNKPGVFRNLHDDSTGACYSEEKDRLGRKSTVHSSKDAGNFLTNLVRP
jgi:GAF domain-containing protein